MPNDPIEYGTAIVRDIIQRKIGNPADCPLDDLKAACWQEFGIRVLSIEAPMEFLGQSMGDCGAWAAMIVVNTLHKDHIQRRVILHELSETITRLDTIDAWHRRFIGCPLAPDDVKHAVAVSASDLC